MAETTSPVRKVYTQAYSPSESPDTDTISVISGTSEAEGCVPPPKQSDTGGSLLRHSPQVPREKGLKRASSALTVRVPTVLGRLCLVRVLGNLPILIAMVPSSSHIVRLSFILTKPSGSNVRKKNEMKCQVSQCGK